MRIVLDWDGTITEQDSIRMVVDRFGDPDVFRRAEARLERRLTLHEVISSEIGTITAPLDEVVAWLLEHVRLRPGFAELLERRSPLIVSAGFHDFIEPVLAREGLHAHVVANRLDPDPAGWRALFRFSDLCGHCGEPCKRAAVAGLGPYVYVGDGLSDRCIALAAERVLARDGLARYLDDLGVAYEPFEDFASVRL